MYNEIIKEFNATESEIRDLYFDYTIVLEETMSSGSNTTVDDNTNKQSFAKKLIDKIGKIIQELFAIIDKKFSKLATIMGRVGQTDEGFKREIRTAIKNNKPLEGIKLISFQYNDNVLETELNKMTSVMLDLMKSLKTGYAEEKRDDNQHPMDLPSDELYKYIFDKMGCPKEITNINAYYEYVKHKFQGNKKEQLYVSSKTREYYNITMSYSSVKRTLDGKKLIMKQQASVLKANLNAIIKNNATQNEIKQRAIKQSSNATHLYNLYTSFLDIYTNLKLEKVMAYRIILKKLYHI